jgi:phosphoribosylanthranilate isomerase
VNAKVKICGITNAYDAEVAIEAGASYLGLIFIAGAPRRIDVERAKAIADQAGSRAKLVGVFCDQELTIIEGVLNKIPLSLVQLHGSETPQFCASVGIPVIKSFCLDLGTCQASDASDRGDHAAKQLLTAIEPYRAVCRHLLIDQPKDKERSQKLATRLPVMENVEDRLGNYFFAGGLTIQNIDLVLNSISPYAIDVASGVESGSGQKNHNLVKRFCDAVMGTEFSGEPSDKEAAC